MKRFLLAYHGSPKFESETDSAAHMAEWKAWAQGLGSAIVDPGMPVGMSKTITPTGVEDNGGANPLSGITIIQAEDIDTAIGLAKDCPHIICGGTIEIAETFEMSM